VRGDDTDHVFTVEIANTKNVSALKDYIKDKNKHTLEQVDAKTLNLYKVSIPVDDGFEENVGKVELGDEHELLAVKRLAGVFVDRPKEGHLHIIVKSPHESESPCLIIACRLTSRQD
jgi:hypothetical protein